MLVIQSDECIDCGVCEPECPADAIRAGHRAGPGEVARGQYRIRRGLHNITQKKESPADAKDFEGMEGKFEMFQGTRYRRLIRRRGRKDRSARFGPSKAC